MRKILSIQYLRGFAALTVVWLHGIYSVPSVAALFGAPFFGGSGVDLFFVISGFIMVAITADKEVSPGRFLLLRIVRVVPLYWLATFVVVIFEPHSPAEVLKSCLFWPYATLGPGRGIWPVLLNGWTLNYEMFFYVLFALSLAGPRALRVWGTAGLLTLLAVAGKLFGPFAGTLAYFYSSPMILEFAAGMIIAHVCFTRGAPRSLPLVAIALALGFYAIGASHSRLVIMSGAFLIVAASIHPRISFLWNRPLLAVGNASYSIYLSHQFVADGLAWASSRVSWRVTWATSHIYVVVALILSVVLGLLCYQWLERPLLSLLHDAIDKRKRPERLARVSTGEH